MSFTALDGKRLDDLYQLQRRVQQEIAAALNVRRPKSLVAVCGTDGGYYRHLRTLSEPACDDCKKAHRAYERSRSRRARGAA